MSKSRNRKLQGAAGVTDEKFTEKAGLHLLKVWVFQKLEERLGGGV